MPEKERRLQGRVAVITGSATGIGRATATLFAAHGAALVLVDASASRNQALRDELRDEGASAQALTVDLRDRAAVERSSEAIAREHQVVDVLVNNAGALLVETIDATTLEQWDEMHDLHVTAPFVFIRNLLPSLRRSAGASIVNNASIDGLFGHPLMPAYGTAKGAMVAMTRNFAYSLGQEEIRINCLATGGIDTPLIAGLADSARAALDRATPLGRLGTPDEVARTTLFLATDESSFMTGSVLTVDGGRTAITAGIASMSSPDPTVPHEP